MEIWVSIQRKMLLFILQTHTSVYACVYTYAQMYHFRVIKNLFPTLNAL